MSKLSLIGLIGKNGSGKSSVCEYLQSKGYTVFSLSDIVREEARTQGLELTRDNLVFTANQLKIEEGDAYLAEQSIEKAYACESDFVVFDSIRNVAEAQFLQQNGTYLLGIDAPVELRYQRIVRRQNSTDLISLETFIAHDERENTGVSFGQNIDAALSLCEQTIINEGSLDKLFEQVDRAILFSKSDTDRSDTFNE